MRGRHVSHARLSISARTTRSVIAGACFSTKDCGCSVNMTLFSQVVMEPAAGGQKLEMTVNRWLHQGKEDGDTVREIAVT